MGQGVALINCLPKTAWPPTYTQRASVPTACDLKLSSELTNYAVDLALKNVHGISVGSHGSKYKSTPIEKANKMVNKNKKNEVIAFNKKNKI